MLQYLLSGMAWVFGVAGGLSFWVGGRAIHEVIGTDRAFAEMEGIALALVLFLLAVVSKTSAERVEKGDNGELVSLAIGAESDREKSA